MSVVGRRLFGSAEFWWAHRGPVVEPGSPEAAALFALLGRRARAEGAFALRVDPEWRVEECRHLGSPTFARVPLHADWYQGAIQPVRVWRLSLEGGAEGVSRRLEPRTRRDVALALRRGARVRPGTHRDLAALYALEHATARRRGFSLRSPEFFERLWRAWNEEGLGELLVADDGGRLVGGLWSVYLGRGAWGQFAATDPEARRLLPATALYWAAIGRAIERGASFFDCGGIDHRTDRPDGLRSFKKGFGPGDTRFGGEHDLVARPTLYRAFRLAEDLHWAWHGVRRRAGRDPSGPATAAHATRG